MALSTGLRRHCHPRKAAPAPSVSWAEISLQVSQGHLLLTQPSSFVHSFTELQAHSQVWARHWDPGGSGGGEGKMLGKLQVCWRNRLHVQPEPRL